MIEDFTLLDVYKADIRADMVTVNKILEQSPYKYETYTTKRQMIIGLMIFAPWFLVWTCSYLIDAIAYITYKGSLVNMASIYLALLGFGALFVAIRFLYCALRENVLEFEVFYKNELLDHHGLTGKKRVEALHKHFRENWRED